MKSNDTQFDLLRKLEEVEDKLDRAELYRDLAFIVTIATLACLLFS